MNIKLDIFLGKIYVKFKGFLQVKFFLMILCQKARLKIQRFLHLDNRKKIKFYIEVYSLCSSKINLNISTSLCVIFNQDFWSARNLCLIFYPKIEEIAQSLKNTLYVRTALKGKIKKRRWFDYFVLLLICASVFFLKHGVVNFIRSNYLLKFYFFT